jgi:hypothetical protein
MIANDVPAISSLFDIYGSGICVDDFSPKSIASAIESISKDYDAFSSGSKDLFESVNMKSLIETVIS